MIQHHVTIDDLVAKVEGEYPTITDIIEGRRNTPEDLGARLAGCFGLQWREEQFDLS
jgi:plasmid maintenance system antidote protein VapI